MGRVKRKTKTNEVEDPASMYRLQLGKTETEFFSQRGNNRLKQIWLDNGLDEESIFASWTGPSEALIREKVSDYLQAFLLRRLRHMPIRDTGMLSFLRRFSAQCDLTLNSDAKEKLDYYHKFIQTTHKKQWSAREKAEKLRIEKSIANNDLPMMHGFEYVSNHPIYRTEQLEKRMTQLSKIPMFLTPFDFEKHILPIMTSYAIAKEIKRKNITFSTSKNITEHSSPEVTLLDLTDDSGVSSKGSNSSNNACSTDDASDSDNDLVQIFSEMELATKDLNNALNESFNDVCDVCGGFNKDATICNDSGPLCTCMSDSIWDDSCSLTAATLYTHASKVLNLHAKQHNFSEKYVKETAAKSKKM